MPIFFLLSVWYHSARAPTLHFGLSTTYNCFPSPWVVMALRFHRSPSAVRRAAENFKSKSAGVSFSGSYLLSFSCQSARLLFKCCVESYCDGAAICVIGSYLNKQRASTDRPLTWSIPPLTALIFSVCWEHTLVHSWGFAQVSVSRLMRLLLVLYIYYVCTDADGFPLITNDHCIYQYHLAQIYRKHQCQ